MNNVGFGSRTGCIDHEEDDRWSDSISLAPRGNGLADT